MKKLAVILAAALLSTGCSARTGTEKGPDVPASQAQGTQEGASSHAGASERDEEPEPAASENGEDPGSSPTAGPSESAPISSEAEAAQEMDAEELMRYGTVGEDGLSYRNDALGLQLALPASSTGRPWHFVQKAAEDGGPGISISVCYDESEETSIIRVSAVTQQAYQQIAKNDYPHMLMGGNSRWAFLFSISNGIPEGIESEGEQAAYTTMRREARDWEAPGRTIIEEPSIP